MAPTMVDKRTNRHAEGNYIEYTPVADMAAGDAIKLGSGVGAFMGVAENFIAANKQGSLAVNGIFRMYASDTGIGSAVAIGDVLDYDFTDQEIVAAAGGDPDIDVIAAAPAASDQTVVMAWINKVG